MLAGWFCVDVLLGVTCACVLVGGDQACNHRNTGTYTHTLSYIESYNWSVLRKEYRGLTWWAKEIRDDANQLGI